MQNKNLHLCRWVRVFLLLIDMIIGTNHLTQHVPDSLLGGKPVHLYTLYLCVADDRLRVT